MSSRSGHRGQPPKDPVTPKKSGKQSWEKRRETPRQLIQRLRGRSSDLSVGRLEEAWTAIRDAPDDWWNNPEAVRSMARTFASRLNIAVPEERLNALVDAYAKAMSIVKTPQRLDPVEFAETFGGGKIDVDYLKQLKQQVESGQKV